MNPRLLLTIPAAALLLLGCAPDRPPAEYEDLHAPQIQLSIERSAPRHQHIGFDPSGMPVYGVDAEGHPIHKPLRDR